MGPNEAEKILYAKDTIIWAKWQPIELGKAFTSYASDKVLASRINKELKQNKQNPKIKKKNLNFKNMMPFVHTWDCL